jgi:nicotinate dehydrogenase subunit B
MMELPGNLKNNPMLDRWIGVDADGLMVRSGKVELGQGIATAMAAIAASELRIDPLQIRVMPADTVLGPNEGYTAGSFSVEHGGPAMRVAAAMTRQVFADAAARHLGAEPEDLVVQDGLFRLPGQNAAISYAELAGAVDLHVSALDRAFPALLGLADSAVGLKRPDLPAKLSGAAYVQDIRLPGMLHGRVLRPASPNLRLVDLDRDRVAALPGVVAVVMLGSFAGVVARRDDQALAAIAVARKSARWAAISDLPADDDAMSWMDATPVPPRIVASAEGEAPAGLKMTARFARPYLLHASVGPACAVADWRDDGATIHTHSQGIYPLRAQMARVLGVPVESLTLIHAHGAGCYGHNGADDVALDAALLSRAVKAPVMVLWSRRDEMTWSPHAAAMRVELSATLSDKGRITDWHCRVESAPHLARPGMGEDPNLLAAAEMQGPVRAAPPSWSAAGGHAGFFVADRGGDRNARPLYDLPRLTVLHHELPQGPLRSSAMRALGAHLNVFAIEGFLDELAQAAQCDPVAFRLRHMTDPRGAAVIRAAALAADWDEGDAGGEGVGRGMAFARYKNTGAYYACVVRVAVEESVRVLSVHGAVDAGRVIHPDGLLNQIEGGVVQAASWTLLERAGWSEDGFAGQGWDSYPIWGFRDIPPIHTAVLPSTEASLGAGECAAGPVAAAIGNAVAHALGVRVRQMPMTRDRLMAAIQGGM